MKLLIDENLAPGLVAKVANLFPDSMHVQDANLGESSDAELWEFAKQNGFALITKDKDFASLSLTFGAPPKVVLLQAGNCSTDAIERLIRANAIRFTEKAIPPAPC